jgi:sarcosine/dimethylglycine N-methyltransferase
MTSPTDAVQIARTYYDSSDADRFYATIWGGEDIHVGLYDDPADSIVVASRRTVERMATKLATLPPGATVLDLGSGYAGAACHLARTAGLRVVALNLSRAQNERARALVRERGLDRLVEVVDGSFEDVPFGPGSFDAVWSQDAILHSGDRARVFDEIGRVLRPGGHLVFTDPMQSDDCPPGVLEPILARIHLTSLASPAFYRAEADRVGLQELELDDLSEHLPLHYGAVLRETERRHDTLVAAITPAYIERMKAGLRHWIDGGEAGHLRWGIFHFRRSM